MKSILLVDDSRAVRLAARKMIAPLGFQILEAGDGEEALRVARANETLDAVLLDWNMPVMDGLAFLKALRAEPRATQPRVVMCTTENDMPHILSALQSGANEYIMKPFTDEIVREKLTTVGLL